MIKGILIGVGIALGIEALIIFYMHFNRIINEKILWFFSPFFHPITALYVISIGLNPWRLSISKILNLSDKQFEGWLKVLNKKDREAWIKRKNGNTHCKIR